MLRLLATNSIITITLIDIIIITIIDIIIITTIDINTITITITNIITDIIMLVTNKRRVVILGPAPDRELQWVLGELDWSVAEK